MRFLLPKTASAKNVVALVLLVVASSLFVVITNAQAGPQLDLTRVELNGYFLGQSQSEVEDPSRLARDIERYDVGFYNGRCIGASGYSISDGRQVLKTGFITRANLMKRLGRPLGFKLATGHFGGNPIWIYEFTLEEAVDTQSGITRKAFLNVHFDQLSDLLHIHGFEITVEGGYMERYPWLGWEIDDSGHPRRTDD